VRWRLCLGGRREFVHAGWLAALIWPLPGKCTGDVPAESARQRTDGCRKKTRGRGAFPSSVLGITGKEFDGRGKLSSMRIPKIGDRVMAIAAILVQRAIERGRIGI